MASPSPRAAMAPRRAGVGLLELGEDALDGFGGTPGPVSRTAKRNTV